MFCCILIFALYIQCQNEFEIDFKWSVHLYDNLFCSLFCSFLIYGKKILIEEQQHIGRLMEYEGNALLFLFVLESSNPFKNMKTLFFFSNMKMKNSWDNIWGLPGVRIGVWAAQTAAATNYHFQLLYYEYEHCSIL